MLKSFVVAASLAMLALTGQANAAEAMVCDEASMTKMEADGAKMTDATKKAAAMVEITAAKDMMAKKDNAGCITHMEAAAKLMPAVM